MGNDRMSVFDLAAAAAPANGGRTTLLPTLTPTPPAGGIGAPQRPSGMPSHKYVSYERQVPFDFPERTWPTRRLSAAPRWCSVDLRDGNQALVEPMDAERKLRFWNLLVSMGFKEIEVGFPSASETDFGFIRMLIEDGHIPEDVTIVVLTQAREHLIRRTYECLRGARRAVVHFYNSVSVLQREVVFRKDRAAIERLATDAARLCRSLEAEIPDTDLFYEYSPESFTGAEPDYAVQVCNAVIGVVDPSPAHPMVVNLPATVEMTTPNVFADEVEYVSTHLDRRDSVVLSLHPHNDQGMAVAAAELGLLAGADRIEGCLLGNGERTGNVDVLALALNLLTQGIDPELDCSDVPAIRETVEYCNRIPISERHPYAGDLVFTAFSGSHQDAIKKGLEARETAARRAGAAPEDFVWLVPYLPIDPKDIGRSYEAIIRVNSQSGKGGMAYLLKHASGLDLPKALQAEFDQVVQAHAEHTAGEISGTEIWRLFQDEYLPAGERVPVRPGVPSAASDASDGAAGQGSTPWGRFALAGVSTASEGDGAATSLQASLTDRAQGGASAGEHRISISGQGNGPLAAFLDALRGIGVAVSVEEYVEHALTAGTDALAASYIACRVGAGSEAQVIWGVGIDSSITTSSLKAVVSAVNRSLR